MCGIFGIWQLDQQPINIHKVQQATTTLRHRGPDDEGYLLVNNNESRVVLCGGRYTDARLRLPLLETYQSETFELALGFRRLAILDLSPSGHQPMTFGDGRYWIVYNGEVYNYQELRQELKACGHTFLTETDTEVILAAYQQWGVASLTRFNGMWGFAIWDTQQQELFLARDRFGVKPLYYSYEQGRFAFASEIKALVGPHGRPFAPEAQALYEYVVSDQLPSAQRGDTFFQGVKALPAGHWLRVRRDGTLFKERYYTVPLHAANGHVTHVDETVAAYRELFIDAVRLRLRADVPIGTCLSGGLDSSSIVGVVNRLMVESGLPIEQIGQQQKTFSAVYTGEQRYNEQPHIEKVLAATHAERNFTVPTLEQLNADLEKLVWHQDEPFGSTSIFAQWCVMRKVHECGVTVLLDGQGADEALAGYRPYLYFFSDLLRQAQLGRLYREARAMEANTGLSANGLLQQVAARQMPAQVRTLLGRRRRLEQANVALLNPDFATNQQAATKTSQRNLSNQASLSSHLLGLIEETRLPDLLRYEDRNSMAFSVEARTPFVDYRLVEFSFNQAANLRIHQGWTKWVLRQAMAEMVPADIVWRKDKVGFETPQLEWLTSLLRDQENWFGPQALSGQYLNLGEVRQRLPAMLQQLASNQGLLWRLMNVEAWLRVWQAARYESGGQI